MIVLESESIERQCPLITSLQTSCMKKENEKKGIDKCGTRDYRNMMNWLSLSSLTCY